MERKTVTLDDILRRHALEHGERLELWHRHLVTLASGGLTLLVSLQSNYVPEDPRGLFLLQTCWIALAVGICSGLLVLFGSAQTRLDAANDLLRMRRESGDIAVAAAISQSGGGFFQERWIFRVARHLLVAGFLVALVSLAWFAVLNVDRVR